MDGRPKLGAMKRRHGWLGEMVASGGAVLLFHILSRHHPDNHLPPPARTSVAGRMLEKFVHTT